MNAEDLAAILDELGRRLGPTGEYVFRLAVQRVIVSSALSSLAAVLCLVGFGAFIVVAYRSYRGFDRTMKTGGYRDREWMMDGPGFFFAMAGIAATLVAGVAFVVLFASITALLTPEYTALRDILSAVGGVR